MIRKRIKPGTRLAVRLSARERDAILERAFLEPEIEERLRQATAGDAKLVVSLDLDELDDLLGCIAAEANHCGEIKVQRVLDSVCERLEHLLDSHSDAPPAKSVPARRLKPLFTPKQGQYLAFIHLYSKVHRMSPAEADLQRFFKVSPPAVHAMILTLEREGLIERTPGQARSIRLKVATSVLPELT
jgi:repressor LexA